MGAFMKFALIPVISGIMFSFTGVDILGLYNCAYAAKQQVKIKEKSKKVIKPHPKPKQNACSIDSCQ